MVTFRNDCTDPFYDLAFEEVVFQSFPEEEIFYLWRDGPAVVAGAFQDLCREVPVCALRRRGIPVLRRSSGGGTVYHDLGNVNYTYITRQEDMDYDGLLRPAVQALSALGVPARRSRTCDIAVGDRKISGSAQRSARGRILHHGTLLFDADLEVLDQITTRRKNDCFQSKGTRSAICDVANIRPWLAHDMTVEEFQARLLEAVGPDRCLTLTAEQEAEVRRLRDEKYHSWAWTWGRTPPFTYEREGTFAGAPFRASYGARRGILSGVSIRCPALDGERAAALLEGSRLDPERFEAVCRELAGDRWEELLDLLL